MAQLPAVSRLLVGSAIPWMVACGAKTGLHVPETDAGMDADAAMDAEMDADAAIDAPIPCIEIPFDGGPIELPLSTQAELRRADVAFLIDTTASMGDEIDRIREQLRDRLAPGIEAEIPDAQFAVATFADFPVDPFGAPEDNPFELRLPMTDDLAQAQAAMNAIFLGNGRDEAESQVEAMYQIATGEGLGGYVSPSFGCPSGGVGYPCFRTDALPIVLLFTDAPMHNGPGGGAAYGGVIRPEPHRYDEAIDALLALDIRVIGFDSGDGAGANDLRAAATDTNALDSSGGPLVYDIGPRGERLGTGVIDAIKTFAEAVIFDIDTAIFDPDPGDGVDVRDFVEGVVPLRAEPMSGIREIDSEGGVFRGVVSGTTVVFQLTVRNDAVVPGPMPQSFLLEVVFRGDERTRLGRTIVELIIPGADGMGCEDGGVGIAGPE
jgi:hypothetical protein